MIWLSVDIGMIRKIPIQLWKSLVGDTPSDLPSKNDPQTSVSRPVFIHPVSKAEYHGRGGKV